MKTERLPDAHRWYRICEASWEDPLDPTFAQIHGGRWNPPGSWPTLYLSEDLVTARLNLDRFIAGWPYEPEDLDTATGPHLAVATLPRAQDVADVHYREGVASVGLPHAFPLVARTEVVDHVTCQAVGQAARAAGLRGVRCRSAQTAHGAGRELAWFPATARSRAHLVARWSFDVWFWA